MQRQTPTPHTRKRTHLKPSQVAVLQESFVTNALPDATKRSRLARALEVSERTVQIWFQNRRAKARKSEAYSLGKEMSCLVPNVRTGWIEPPKLNHKPSATSSSSHRFRSASSRPNEKKYNHHYNTSPDRVLTSRALSEGTDRPQEIKSPHLSIPIDTLRIGSWARFMSLTPTNKRDLICYCNLLEKTMVWQVQEGEAKFRIEVNLDQISQIQIGQIPSKQQIPSLSTSTSSTSTASSSSSSTTPPAPPLAVNSVGQLQIHVVHPHQVRFSMCQANAEDWVQCADFSENTQASVEPMHILQGNYATLRNIFIDISTKFPELAQKVIFTTPETLAQMHVTKTISPPPPPPPSSSATVLSFDDYMQLIQQQQQHYSLSSPPMFM
ncbi:hypothetical protein BCR42DRAFT_371217 [Absidia repens]|uniref:Homeobox domain-containing protein n=1 Tax=Absidia repens TaxID=90262 RepID=A0A1X2INK1_9FUNG|nr:hypothetical protein BCR42DRAFT_371217 [Absidia repens]